MNVTRNEVRTGILVVVTIGVLVAALIYLGAPGVFVSEKTFRIYFDNAAGLKPGAPVYVAGRKIGTVRTLYSPVPEKDRPMPKLETLVEVGVAEKANIYQRVKVQMVQFGLLNEAVIDFSSGEEASGLAPDGFTYIGERPGGIADAVPLIIEKIDPALQKVTTTLDSLQKTSDNLARLSADGADLPTAFSEFRKFGANLNELSGENSSLRRSLKNVEAITGPDGKLDKTFNDVATLIGPDSSMAKTLRHTERFTADLAENKDLQVALRNFRKASEQLSGTISDLGGKFSAVGDNLEQASDTVKRQPWRLIWPTTKKYDAEGRAQPPQTRLKVATPKPARRSR